MFENKDIVAFLSQTAFFGQCGAGDLFAIVEHAEQQKHNAGSAILPIGWPLLGMGVVLYGRANMMLVDMTSNTDVCVIEQLLPGHFFGEVSLLFGSSNPISVVAEEDSYTLMIEKSHVDGIMQKYPKAVLALAKELSARFVKLGLIGVRAHKMSNESVAAPNIFDYGSASVGEEGEKAIPWVEVGSFNISKDLLQLVPAPIIRKHRLLPLRLKERILVVGMVNPRSVQGIHDLRRVLHSVDPKIVAISSDDFELALKRLNLPSERIKEGASSADSVTKLEYSVETEVDAGRYQNHQATDIVRLIDKIMIEAINLGASDIHIETGASEVMVRYRVQGSLVKRKEEIDLRLVGPMIARVKILAQLDITDRRQPQDGRIFAKFGSRELNLRVSTMPIARGEKVVIRVLESSDAMRPLHQIIFNGKIEKAVRGVIGAPHGAIVVAGPTGSGKSTTLYAMINERKITVPDNNIVTVEDPVEYLLPEITQVQVGAKGNMGFAGALRAMMRQDPDVIMVGELRDRDTAVIMIEAALTGHLVMTSMHGNNAVAVIQRLQHLGIDPVLLSQALSLIIVQRLTKKLCPACVTLSDVAPTLFDSLVERKILTNTGEHVKLPRPVGCEACGNTGYQGRMAVQEVLSLDDHIRSSLAAGDNPEELVATALERKRYISFAQGASFLISRHMLSPGDALLLVAD